MDDQLASKRVKVDQPPPSPAPGQPPAAASVAVSTTPRRLFTNVQLQALLSVQSDGSVCVQLLTRQTSKAERREERRDRKFELLHANRQHKRQQAKQKRREQKAQQKATRPQPASAALEAETVPAVRRGRQFREWVRSRQRSSPVVCVDCAWDAAMLETEVQSLSKQLKFLYADNMHAQHPLRLQLTSYGHDEAEQRMEVGSAEAASGASVLRAPRLHQYMSRVEGFDRWLMDRSPLHFSRLWPAAAAPSVTYLTAESPNLLTALQPDCVYVIGAVVDHNRLPGMCHSAAVAEGVATARLPITECMRVQSGSRRTVITVNQVFDCLLRWWNLRSERSVASSDEQPWQLQWAAAFHGALPKRGGWQVRDEWRGVIQSSSPTRHNELADESSIDTT